MSRLSSWQAHLTCISSYLKHPLTAVGTTCTQDHSETSLSPFTTVGATCTQDHSETSLSPFTTVGATCTRATVRLVSLPSLQWNYMYPGPQSLPSIQWELNVPRTTVRLVSLPPLQWKICWSTAHHHAMKCCYQ